MATGAETVPFDPDLAARVRAWIDDDPDAQTARHLADLLDLAGESTDDETMRIAARQELADRFAGFLEFGTAGLRGALGGGPNRMNRAVVIRTAAGLVRYLGDVLGADARPRVVIGYDARYLSDTFARDTAAVVTAAGGEALLMPRFLPTPVLAFAVRHLHADAGVMVTASHNPPQDNGYKVYLGGRVVTDAGQGVQIVPPHDAEIAARIAAVPSVTSVPRVQSGWTTLGEDVVDAYLAAVGSLATPGTPRDLRIVTTPLHGVGGELVARVLAGAGFTDLTVVPEQAQPDPAFPTVAFPNPEEPGAIDLALALADATGADLVIANDPDADRCAAAVRDPRAASAHGADSARAAGWRMLHGDEVGALLGDDVAHRLAAAGTTSGVLASSIVSSRLLARIAADHGLAYRSTLTGFKWIARVDGLAFGYEEALGYCVAPDVVRDKDGLSAALLLAQLAARVKAEGRTLVDVLDDLAVRHGLHLTDQLSARFADLAAIGATMDRVRSAPPSTLAGSPVVSVEDLARPEPGPDALPPTDGLRLLAEDGTRVVVRPSGTEPKVKCYLEVIVPVTGEGPDPVGDARRTARARLDAVRDDVAAALGLEG
ncbi:phospho-sugar mutase [Actinotalea fermentans]|uniref:Phosphomannomutase n=1 Tax=Actinotalea fermentans TaxID=43671 RepID=A0A511YWN4_9CELL|nr:phospho-sugar mutase [Actinotalea fermentans]KGM15588.1 phosphomannomutase [Actinotalea fermentans ATCC 43279 = JCM 9966 = DSM 3133]GEN79595.1 phosphomannomutase [Actinotalea fermentans]